MAVTPHLLDLDALDALPGCQDQDFAELSKPTNVLLSFAFKGKEGSLIHPKKKQQTGFFKVKENADKLVLKLEVAGFDGYIVTEIRSDGETRYLVVVDENETLSMGKKLKAAGFDCYMIEK